MLEKVLADQKLLVHCDTHPGITAEYFSRSTNTLVCQKCLIESHKDSVLLECTAIDGLKMKDKMEEAL
jgi:hypothetical protein